jgi:hypothetical protein
MENREKLYDYIASDYYKMSKDNLKNYALEALYQLSENTTEKDFKDCCEMIYDAVNPKEDEETYSLIKFYQPINTPHVVLEKGLSLLEAQEKTKKDNTTGTDEKGDWFIGFRKE